MGQARGPQELLLGTGVESPSTGFERKGERQVSSETAVTHDAQRTVVVGGAVVGQTPVRDELSCKSICYMGRNAIPARV